MVVIMLFVNWNVLDMYKKGLKVHLENTKPR